MHVRPLRFKEAFIPIRDPSRRREFARRLRRLLGSSAKIQTLSTGVRVRGDLSTRQHEAFGELAAKVSDWVKS